MDWSKIDLSEVFSELEPKKSSALKVRSGELPLQTYYRLVVMSKVLKKSMGAMTVTALHTYLNRNTENHENMLIAEAKARGITPEELFQGLATGDIEL